MEANIHSLGTVPKIRWALSPCNKQSHKEDNIRAPISQMRKWRHKEAVWLVQGPTVHLCTCTWSLCSLAPPAWFLHSICQAKQTLSMLLSCFLFNIISTASLKKTIWGFLYCVCRSGLTLPCFLLFWGFGAVLKYLAEAEDSLRKMPKDKVGSTSPPTGEMPIKSSVAGKNEMMNPLVREVWREGRYDTHHYSIYHLLRARRQCPCSIKV